MYFQGKKRCVSCRTRCRILHVGYRFEPQRIRLFSPRGIFAVDQLRCKIRQWRSAFRKFRNKDEIFGWVAIPPRRTHSLNFQLLLRVYFPYHRKRSYACFNKDYIALVLNQKQGNLSFP